LQYIEKDIGRQADAARIGKQGSVASTGALFAYAYLAHFPLCMVFSQLQMESLMAFLPYAEITLSLLLIAGIVLQQRGAGLGGAFGGDNFASTFYKRRGAEKFLFNATIVVAVLFVLTAITHFLTF
jgi:preprotein translocase subunit SecG